MIGGATDRDFCRSLLNGQPFPAFPFSDPDWLGFIFNRDLHNAAGVSTELFEAAATAASQVLRDGRTSAASKSAAGSALSQRKK